MLHNIYYILAFPVNFFTYIVLHNIYHILAFPVNFIYIYRVSQYLLHTGFPCQLFYIYRVTQYLLHTGFPCQLYLLYRGLVHHHHRILYLVFVMEICISCLGLVIVFENDRLTIVFCFVKRSFLKTIVSFSQKNYRF